MSPANPRRPIGWSHDSALWKALSRLATHCSWTRTTLDSNLALHVPESLGVYLICAHPPYATTLGQATYTVLYAGKVDRPTRTLRNRFLEHCRQPTPALRPFLLSFHPNVHFWSCSIGNPAEISQVESLLFASFNPPANMIRPPGTRILLARLGKTTPLGRQTTHPSS